METWDSELKRRIAEIGPGDHLCCIYQTEEEHSALLTPYLRLGLERGEKILYIVDAHAADEILDYLWKEGMDPGPYLDSGQMVVLCVDDAYMKGGVFDPDGMIAMLSDETEKALEEGFSALRVTGEMSWALKGLPGSERLVEYEAKLNRFLPGSRALAICQYDRRRFDPQVLLYVLTTHPKAVVGTEVYDNFYYIAPDELLGERLQESILRHWIDHLDRHKRSQRALRESEEKYRELTRNLPQVVFELDAGGNITYVNEVAHKIFGYGDEEIARGITALDIIHHSDHPRIGRAIQKMMDGRSEGATREYLAVRKDGTTFPCLVYSALVKGEDGAPAGIRGILADISERKKAEEALKRVNQDLDAYAGIVSHDLRGPLSVIISASDTLKGLIDKFGREGLAGDIGDTAEIINRSAVNAEVLIDSLLALAQSGQVPKKVTAVDMGKAVESVLGERKQEIDEMGVRIIVEPDLGRVEADPTHIYQLFSNLVANSVKYNDNPRPELEIRYLGDDGAGGVRYLVRDNGPGFPPGDTAEIFKPLYRGVNGGTGLGLAIVKRIIDTYGGDIKAFNDGGANFEFNLKDYQKRQKTESALKICHFPYQ